MAVVQLRIGGQVYALSCGDGQEKNLEALAAKVDEKVKAVKSHGFVPENLALVMAAIFLADEASRQPPAPAAQKETAENVDAGRVRNAADRMEKVIQRISAVAQSFENA